MNNRVGAQLDARLNQQNKNGPGHLWVRYISQETIIEVRVRTIKLRYHLSSLKSSGLCLVKPQSWPCGFSSLPNIGGCQSVRSYGNCIKPLTRDVVIRRIRILNVAKINIRIVDFGGRNVFSNNKTKQPA